MPEFRYYDPNDNEWGCLVPPDEEGFCAGVVFRLPSPEETMQMFAGEKTGNMYHGTSDGQPTVRQFGRFMTGAEAGIRAPLYDTYEVASGMTAITLLIFQLAKTTKKNEFVLSPAVYGGVYHHLLENLSERNIIFRIVEDPFDCDLWRRCITEKTVALLAETPSNPCADVLDIIQLGKLAREMNVFLVADNTVNTPVLQRPLELGADFVWESCTKSIGGFAEGLGGTITGPIEFMRTLRKEWGTGMRPVMDPLRAKAFIKSLDTLHPREHQRSKNGLKLAECLAMHQKVKSVSYPFLSPLYKKVSPKQKRNYEIAQQQMFGGGGLLYFEVDGGRKEAWNVLRSFTKVIPAVHIGFSQTLASHSRTSTHYWVPDDVKDRLGITESGIRISLGHEPSDFFEKHILPDFDEALKKI